MVVICNKQGTEDDTFVHSYNSCGSGEERGWGGGWGGGGGGGGDCVGGAIVVVVVIVVVVG